MTTPEQAQALGARAERRMQARVTEGYVPGMVADAAEQDDPAPDTIDDGEDDPTADLRAEIAKLKQDLAAANGRTAPVQRDLETYRQLAVELQRNLDAQRTELEQLRSRKQEEAFDPASVLDAEELEEIDPLVLKVMAKIAGARKGATNVEAEVARVLEQRQQQELKEYREQALLSRDLSDIVTLRNDPSFIAWAEQDDNDVESVVTMLLGASTKPAIDKYARLLKRKIDSYRDSIKAPSGRNSASDANTSINAGMRRKQTSQLTDGELNKRLAQARRLARSRSAEDRKKASTILNSLGG